MGCARDLRVTLLLSVLLASSPTHAELVARTQELRDQHFEATEMGEAERRAVLEALDETIAWARPLGVGPRLRRIRTSIVAEESPAALEPHWTQLLKETVRAGRVLTAPRRPPDLAHGARLYAVSCAICHGAEGNPPRVMLEALAPPPTSFHDPDAVNPISPFRAFNAITYGAQGTAMPGFGEALSEHDRWSLAFFVFALRQPRCEVRAPEVGWGELARSTDNQLNAKYSEPAVACLRRLERGGPRSARR
jgi:high-affinity iron transporter